MSVKLITLGKGDVKLAPGYENNWYTLAGERIAMNKDTDQGDLRLIQKTENNKVYAKDGTDNDGKEYKKGDLKLPGTWHEQIVIDAEEATEEEAK